MSADKYIAILQRIFERQHVPPSSLEETAQQAVLEHLEKAVIQFRNALTQISSSGLTIPDTWVLPNIARNVYLATSKQQFLQLRSKLPATAEASDSYLEIVATMEATRVFVQESLRGQGLQGELPKSIGHIGALYHVHGDEQERQISNTLVSLSGEAAFEHCYTFDYHERLIATLKNQNWPQEYEDQMLAISQSMYESVGDPDV